ncbi:MAG TPA: nuclear transport factor 2 family protein, partial [Actinomycetes bacterium]|nr:nuclear transport factor 2 family protein [Actinomycetes bacterium]
KVRRITGAGEVWVVEGVNDYGGGDVWSWVVIMEFRDGKIWKETRYYAEPFDPPAWRADWSKRIEEPVAG